MIRSGLDALHRKRRQAKAKMKPKATATPPRPGTKQLRPRMARPAYPNHSGTPPVPSPQPVPTPPKPAKPYPSFPITKMSPPLREGWRKSPTFGLGMTQSTVYRTVGPPQGKPMPLVDVLAKVLKKKPKKQEHWTQGLSGLGSGKYY